MSGSRSDHYETHECAPAQSTPKQIGGVGRKKRNRTVISRMDLRRIALCCSRALFLLGASDPNPTKTLAQGLKCHVKFTDLAPPV
jgi:hypothetical protein